MKKENKKSSTEYDKFIQALQEVFGNMIFKIETDEEGKVKTELSNSEELKKKYNEIME